MKNFNSTNSHNTILSRLISSTSSLFSKELKIGNWSFSFENFKYNLQHPMNMFNNNSLMSNSLAWVGAMACAAAQTLPEDCSYVYVGDTTILLTGNDNNYMPAGQFVLSLSSSQIPEFNDIKIQTDPANKNILNLVYKNISEIACVISNGTIINGNTFNDYFRYKIIDNWCTKGEIFAQLMQFIGEDPLPDFQSCIQTLVNYVLAQNRSDQTQKDNWTIGGLSGGSALLLIITCCAVYRCCKLKRQQQQNLNINSAPQIESQPFLFKKPTSYQSTVNNNEGTAEETAPHGTICPITQEPMKDPVVTADGISYERKAIETWFKTKQTSPATGKPLPNKNLIPNVHLKQVIEDLTNNSKTTTLSQ